MYFEQFPKLNYDFPFEDIYGVEMLDVFRRVAFKFDDYSKHTRSTFDYIPEAGDTADIIAEKIYGNADYWWLVCLFSGVINPYKSFPRSGADQSDEQSEVNFLYLYLDRVGSPNETRDFKVGDTIVLGTALGVSFDFRDTNLKIPAPLKRSSGENVRGPRTGVNVNKHYLGRVVGWDQTLRQAKIIPNGKNFTQDITVAKSSAPKELNEVTTALVFDDAGDLQVYGRVLRFETNEDQKLIGFQNKKNAFPISPLYNVKTTKIAGASASTSFDVRIKKSTNVIDYRDTIIYQYLTDNVPALGNSGGTYAESYIPVFQQVAENNSRVNETALRKLKLLDPKYKEEAFRLFKDTIKSTRFTVNEFSTLAETTRTREFYPRSGNPNPTIIL